MQTSYLTWNHWYSSVGKGTYCQVRRPEFNPPQPTWMKERSDSASCPLTPAFVLWHVHPHTY